MFLATDSFVAFDLLLFTNLDVALVAGSAASVINIIDAQIDINMARTSRRPIAQGRVSVKSGILFSAVTGIACTRFRVYCLVNAPSSGTRWSRHEDVQVFKFLPDDAFYLPSH